MPVLAEITTILEPDIFEKSSVPWTKNFELAGIAFATSSDSPIALSFERFSNKTSSNALDAQRNPIVVPTLPVPIIEIS